MTEENLTETDTITLTKKEVREAREILRAWEAEERNGCFLTHEQKFCEPFGKHDAHCRLCKKLTEFASQGDSEEEVVKDEQNT